MSSYSFPSSSSSGNDNSDDVFFDISEYLALAFADEAQEESPALLPITHHRHRPVEGGGGDDAEAAGDGRINARPVDGNYGGFAPGSASRGREDVGRSTAASVGQRVAFRTKTELETLDDGYKWRKYGKKKVKNSPNPRNYYRCSSEGCNVKKRVQRATDDSSYLVTTYDGIHTHEAPSRTGMPQTSPPPPPAFSSEYYGC